MSGAPIKPIPLLLRMIKHMSGMQDWPLVLSSAAQLRIPLVAHFLVRSLCGHEVAHAIYVSFAIV